MLPKNGSINKYDLKRYVSNKKPKEHCEQPDRGKNQSFFLIAKLLAANIRRRIDLMQQGFDFPISKSVRFQSTLNLR